MIDLEFAIEFFNKYITEYPNTPRVKLKIDHILRVMKISINLAKQLELSEEDIKLAGLIGLLHDIGRFEQVKVYDTFVDKDSINHAIYSSEQLFGKGLIRKFIKDTQYDNIIKKAVENHNKFQIEEGLDDRTLLHCKIIRDADKSDIYEQVLQSDGKLVFDGVYDENATIAKKVLEDFYNNKNIKTEDMKTVLDDYVRKESLIYGLYFKESLYYIKEKEYTSRLTRKFMKTFKFLNKQTIEEINSIDKHIIDYLNSY